MIDASDITTDASLPQLVTVREAAAALSLSPISVRRLEREGRLRGYRLGGALRIRVEDIHRLLDEAASAPRREAPPELLAAGGRPPRRRK